MRSEASDGAPIPDRSENARASRGRLRDSATQRTEDYGRQKLQPTESALIASLGQRPVAVEVGSIGGLPKLVFPGIVVLGIGFEV